VVLLLHEDLADGLAKGELVELVALLDSAAIVGDGLALVFEVEAQHVFGFLGGLDGLGDDGGHTAEIVDVIGEGEGEFFGGVHGELVGDIHVLRRFSFSGAQRVNVAALFFMLAGMDSRCSREGRGRRRYWARDG
jgi:hypothetical protein